MPGVFSPDTEGEDSNQTGTLLSILVVLILILALTMVVLFIKR
jgi:hypothetical protein